jgi:hypothetical protein
LKLAYTAIYDGEALEYGRLWAVNVLEAYKDEKWVDVGGGDVWMRGRKWLRIGIVDCDVECADP